MAGADLGGAGLVIGRLGVAFCGGGVRPGVLAAAGFSASSPVLLDALESVGDGRWNVSPA